MLFQEAWIEEMLHQLFGLGYPRADVGEIRADAGKADHGRFAEKVVPRNRPPLSPAAGEIGGTGRATDRKRMTLQTTFRGKHPGAGMG